MHTPVKFHCPACSKLLSVAPSHAGTSGPCPACGTWIHSPAHTDSRQPAAQNQPAPIRKKGRIPADSFIDHAHLQNRESMQSLKILALFVLAICACLAAIWFMRDWMGH